jgi:ATP-binding cassette subfamily B protein
MRRLLVAFTATVREIRRRWGSTRRIRVIYQFDAVECGTSCLAMVLAYFGHRRALPAARGVCDPGRDGMTLDELTAAARALGLQVRVHALRSFDELVAVPLPAIAHWHRNHFVVLERLRRDALVIIDPARGRLTITKAEFQAASGALLTFACTVAWEPGPADSSGRGLSFLVDLVRAAGAWRSLTLLAGYSLALQIVGLITPVLTQLVVDSVIPARRVSPLTWLALGIVAVVCSQVLLRYVRAAALTRLQARLDLVLMTRFVSHLLDLPLRFFQQRSAGDLLMRLAANSTVRELITGQSLGILFDGLFVSGYLLLLFLWSPLFAGIALALGALQATVLLSARSTLKDVTDRHLAAQADAHGTLVEALHGIASLKTLGAEPFIITRWTELFRRQMDLAVRRQVLAGTFESGLASLRLFSTLVFLWCGAREVLLGHLTLGTMLGLNALAAGFLLPIGSLVGNLQQFHLVQMQLERIFDVLDAPPEQALELRQPGNRSWVRPGIPPEPASGFERDLSRARYVMPRRRPVRLSGTIAFDRVSFRYHAGAPFVLRDVSFTIRPGRCVAILGRTGSGKSTLASLLLGLHEPTHGMVLLDGAPLPSFDYRALRQQCGAVFQDSLVFALSIRDNIACGRTDVEHDAIVRAATLAEIHDEIVRMPMGYDTCLLDGGSGLSAGQRQRLLLARALVHEPALLVLDEATSHLDAEAEQRIVRTIHTLPCTRLLITHHLATIQHADLLIVLDAGRIVEAGAPGDLLARGGLYATWSARYACGHARDRAIEGDYSGRGFAFTDRGG